jgi:hypothetical protein
MKRSLYVLMVLFAFATLIGCKPSVPSDIIQPGDLEDILYDYHVAQAMASDDQKGDYNFERTKYFLAVLQKHGVTQAEFDTAMIYYYGHLDRLKPIYLEVNERLSDEAKSLGATVGSIGRYSGYSTTGDTANIWQNRTSLLLVPRPTMNRFDFTVDVDTSFYKGDSFMFQFMSDYIWQTGSKDAVVCIVTKYEGDSINQTTNHVSVSGIAQIHVPANHEKKLKQLSGFIYLTSAGNEETTRKMMFINQIQLIRFHNKQISNEAKTDSISSDSIQRGGNARGADSQAAGSGTDGRSSLQSLSVGGGAGQHRVVPRPDGVVKR